MACFTYLKGLRPVWRLLLLLLLCRCGFCNRFGPRNELQSPHTAAPKAIAPSCYACTPTMVLRNKPNSRFKILMQDMVVHHFTYGHNILLSLSTAVFKLLSIMILFRQFCFRRVLK